MYSQHHVILIMHKHPDEKQKEKQSLGWTRTQKPSDCCLMLYPYTIAAPPFILGLDCLDIYNIPTCIFLYVLYTVAVFQFAQYPSVAF